MYQKYNFENLEIYKLALTLVKDIYLLTRKLPKDELFVLTSQLRRAVTSVVLNIAEGSGRGSRKDFARFINQSIGSLFEVKAVLLVALELKYLEQSEINKVIPKIDELFFKLSAFKKFLSK